MSETNTTTMSTFARWIVGVLAIVLFPFTIVILVLYAIFFKIPVFVGMIVEEIINGIKEKWSGR
jgi:hypothetical protein